MILCALSLLTWVPAWHVLVWQAAIIAGEFGHYLGLLSVVLACFILAYWVIMVEPEQHFWRTGAISLILMLVTAGFFFSPTAYALRLAPGLPVKIATAFDTKTKSSRPLQMSRLWLPIGGGNETKVTSHIFTPFDWPERLKLDLYAANKPDAPVVLMVHGGGWDSGDRTQLASFNHWLAGQGYAVAAVSYRLAPTYQWPAQRDDARQAIAWLKSNASDLGIDGNRIVLMGRSAGAQIAGAVAYGINDAAVRGFIGLYGVYDMGFVWSISREDDVLNSVNLMEQYLGGAPTPANQAAYDSASAQGLVERGKTPPTLLIHGTVDTLCWVKHSQRLADALKKSDVPHVFVELPWAVHAFDFNLHGPGGQLTTHAVKEFLTAVTE